MSEQQSRGLWLGLAVAAAVFAAAAVSYQVAIRGVVAVWFPAGIALAALLQAPRRLWPAVLAGVFLGNAAADLVYVSRLWLSLSAPLVNVVESLAAALVVRRFVPGSPLESLRGVAVFVGGAVVLTNALTAVPGGALLTLAYSDTFTRFWFTWWVGDGLGMLVATPAILGTTAWWQGLPAGAARRRHLLEATAVGMGLLILLVVAFNRPGTLNPFLAVLVFPGLILAAIRLNLGAYLALALTTLVVLWYSTHGQGPLVEADLTAIGRALQILSFVALASITILILVATALERRRASIELTRLQTRMLQAEKLEALGRLTGGVAHDSNNMLTVILGHADFAAELSRPDDPIREHLGEIRKAAEHSAELTRQLLGFARRQVVSPRVVPLNLAVERLLGMLRKVIREDVTFTWQPDPESGTVAIDPVQLHQILMNLCINARDAVPSGGSILIETGLVTFDAAYCQAHPGFREGEFALLSITDDGVGIPPDVLAHVFEPFYTTKDTGEGTGLGLATVYGIVKQNRGFVNIYSEPGHGTTVKVYLPRLDAVAAEPATPAGPPTLSGREAVLVVDDDERILRLATRALERHGYRVLAASDVDAAMAFAQAQRVDILVTDVVMPGLNGRQLADRIRGIHPGARVLYTSGYTANVVVHRGILQNGVEFLGKPYTPEQLSRRVRELLDDRSTLAPPVG